MNLWTERCYYFSLISLHNIQFGKKECLPIILPCLTFQKNQSQDCFTAKRLRNFYFYYIRQKRIPSRSPFPDVMAMMNLGNFTVDWCQMATPPATFSEFTSSVHELCHIFSYVKGSERLSSWRIILLFHSRLHWTASFVTA